MTQSHQELFNKSQDDNSEPDYVEWAKSKFSNDKGELDVAALVKSTYNKEKHIQNLEAETSGMRSELDKRLTIEEFMDQLKTSKNNTSGTETETRSEVSGEAPSAQDKSISSKDVNDIVANALKEERTRMTQQQNLQLVRDELTKVYGPNYQEKLNTKATELGLGQDFLGNMAVTHPKAFLKIMTDGAPSREQPSQQNSLFTPPRSTTNVQAITQRTRSDESWESFEQIRKEDPRRYWSVEVQAKMHRLAQEGKLNR